MGAVMSSPLILSFDLRNDAVLDEMWPIITNKDVIAVNQRWTGHPGTRLSASDEAQVWAKPVGQKSHAVFLMAIGDNATSISVPFSNISSDLASATAVCARDLYTKEDSLFHPAEQNLVVHVE